MSGLQLDSSSVLCRQPGEQSSECALRLYWPLIRCVAGATVGLRQRYGYLVTHRGSDPQEVCTRASHTRSRAPLAAHTERYAQGSISAWRYHRDRYQLATSLVAASTVPISCCNLEHACTAGCGIPAVDLHGLGWHGLGMALISIDMP
jgi:hypothetical protein